MPKPNRGPGSVDWHKIKAEFLSTQVSLNALRQRYDLAQAFFFKKTKGWHAEKAALQAKAIGNLKKDITAYFESYIDRACSILDKFAKHYDALLNVGQGVDEHGHMVVDTPLSPDKLLDASKAFAENLKTLQLLKMQADPSTKDRALTEGDLHAVIMTLIGVTERSQEAKIEKDTSHRASFGDAGR